MDFTSDYDALIQFSIAASDEQSMLATVDHAKDVIAGLTKLSDVQLDLTIFTWLSAEEASDHVILDFSISLQDFQVSRPVQRLWLALITGLRCARRLTLLCQLAATVVPRLLPQLLFEESEVATLRTVDLLVLGSQHSPSLFHQCVPYLTQLLDRVKDEGDLLTNDARAYSQFIGTRLQPAVVFAFVGLRLFPGFPALYEPLVSRLSQYPPPSDEATLGVIRGRNWVNPLPFPARALAGIVPKPLTLPPREDDAPFPSLAVGALPWPEGKFTSAYQDITLTVKFSVVGHTVGILLGAEPSSADHGMSMAASLPDVQTLSFRCDAAAGMDPAAVTWEKDVCLLASPAAVSLPPPHTNPLSLTDITTAAGKFGQAYVQCASYIGEGYATVAPLAYPVEESDTVIVRRSRSNFVIGQVVGKRPGYLHCRLFLDADIDDSDSDSLFWCYWPDVYEDKAAEVTNISSNPCETETSWHMNCIGPGSRVFVGVRRGSVFTQGFVTKLLESGAQALVQCDNYTERAVPITQLRAVRPCMKRGGLHSELGAVEDATVTQRLLRCDYMVTGLLKRANVEGSSFFELQLDQWGRVFHGSIYCDGKDRRWAGVKSTPLTRYDIRESLEGGVLQACPVVYLNRHLLLPGALDETPPDAEDRVSGIEGISLCDVASDACRFGGWAPFTVEVWARPMQTGRTQTILSKYRDGVLGEFEFGLLADGRAYARLFCPIVFTLPPHLVVGEAFTLCFEAIGLFTVAKDDWIGLCPIGSANVNIPKNGWYRASDGGGVIAWAKTHAPPAPGWYEFRYFKGAGYSAVGAVSDPIFVKSSASAPVSEEELSRPCPPAGWVVSTRTLPVGAFTHVGITRCGRSLSIILNGELDATATVSFPAPYTDMACSLGFANRRVPCDPFCGQLAELRVWSCPKSPDAITSTLFTRVRGWEPDLLGAWPFSDPDRVLADLSPYAQHGRLTQPLLGRIMPEEPLWAIPDGKSDVQPSPVQAGLNSSIVSRTLAGGPPSVSFGGIARLVGLKAQLWDSAALTPVCGKGSMWLSSRVRVRDGFDVCAEVCSLAEGAHITLTLRACSRWALSPLDGPPVPLFAPSPSSSLPPPVAMPPQTLSIQIAHLKIDRGVFDIRVHARGFLGLGACLGEVRCSGPEPFRVRVVYAGGFLRISLTDFFMHRVEAPVLSIPLSLSPLFGVDCEPVWVGLHGGKDAFAPESTPTPQPPQPPPEPTVPPPSTPKGFPCPHCPKSFTTAVNLGRHTTKEHPSVDPSDVSIGIEDESPAAAAARFLGVTATASGPLTTDVVGLVEVVNFRCVSGVNGEGSASLPFPSASLPFRSVSGILRYSSTLLLDLEASVTPCVINAEWCRSGQVWRRSVLNASSLSQLIVLLMQFGQVIAKAGWSKAWKDTTSDMWNKQITELSISIAELPGELVQESVPGFVDMTSLPTPSLIALAEFLRCLFVMEMGLLKSALNENWTAGSRKWWRASLSSLKRLLKNLLRQRDALTLSSTVMQPPALCLAALKATSAGNGAAADWLYHYMDVLPAPPVFPPELPTESPFTGDFDTSIGCASVSSRGRWSGRQMSGTFGTGGDGTARGFLFTDPQGQLSFRGQAHSVKEGGFGAILLKFHHTCTAFTGKAWFGTKLVSWDGKLDTAPFKRFADTGSAGIRNMGNTCYQNSLLQALFLTDAFRCQILSCVVPAPLTEAAADSTGNPSQVLAGLQQLYASLNSGVSPFVEPIVFHKSLLRLPWGDKQQQDSYQFLLYIWETLEKAMAGRALIDPTSTVAVSPVKELHNALFGGTLVNATVCQNCGHASKRTDPFSELPLTFPSSFTPIIDVTVVCGDSADVAPPSGYDRLPVNVNQGRAGSPFVYLCVRRARSWDDQEVSSADTDGSAITDVCIVTAPLSTAPALPLPPSGFTLLDDDLNEGGTVRVFLALARVPNGCPITALDVGAAQTAKNVKTPHGFEKLPENINAGTTGDVVYLFYKRGGAIRDVVLVGSSHEHKSVPPGYVCVGVDVGMVGTGCIDDEGPECDSATTRIAYTTGGSLAPITGIRVLDRDGLAALLASTDVATGTVMSDISIQSRAKRGVASVPLGSAYGWSSIGVLPGGRYVAVQRGHGSPLGSLSVYRSPAVVPRYGLSGVVDMLPADTLSACLGFTPPPPVPDTASPFTALPKACASVLGKWRSIEGNVNSLTLRPSEPLQRVVGFQVFGMLGDLEEAVPSSGSDVEEEEGKAAPPVEMLSRTGSVLGVLYRPLEDHLAAAGSCAGNWVLDGEWNALDDDDDTYPLRLHVTIPADPSKPPSFSGKRASSVADEEFVGVRAMDGRSWCRGMLRQEAITTLSIISSDAKVPKGAVSISRTVTGESALMRPYGGLRKGGVSGGKKESPPAGVYLCVHRMKGAPPVCGVATTPAPRSEAHTSAMKSASALLRWVRSGNSVSTAEGIGMSLWHRCSGFESGQPPTGDESVEADGPFPPLLVFPEGAPLPSVAYTRPGQVLMDVCLVIDGYEMPPLGYVDSGIRFSSMMSDVSVSLALHLLFSGPHTAGSLPFEGVYHTGEGVTAMELVVQDPFEGYMVNGSLSKVNLGGPAPASSENKPTIAAMTTGSAEFRGVFRARPHSVDKWALDGFWGDATVKFKPGYPIRLGFHPDLKKFEGKLDFGMWSESWTSSFDNYLAIGYNEDPTTLWCLGQPVFSTSVPDNSLLSLIQRFHTPEIVEYNCEECGLRSTAIKRMDVEKYPQHLLAVAKRFEMDWQTDSAIKLMSSVPFPPLFQYPSGSGTPVSFGLYAVLVHSGATLSRGHYYTFGRSSACDHLHTKDCVSHPWAKFDDRDVTSTTFDKLAEFLSRSEAASAYMLFYRRLDEDGRVANAVEPPLGMSSLALELVVKENESLVRSVQHSTGDAFLEEFHQFFSKRLHSLSDVRGIEDIKPPVSPLVELPSDVLDGLLDDSYCGLMPFVCPNCNRTLPKAMEKRCPCLPTVGRSELPVLPSVPVSIPTPPTQPSTAAPAVDSEFTCSDCGEMFPGILELSDHFDVCAGPPKK